MLTMTKLYSYLGWNILFISRKQMQFLWNKSILLKYNSINKLFTEIHICLYNNYTSLTFITFINFVILLNIFYLQDIIIYCTMVWTLRVYWCIKKKKSLVIMDVSINVIYF